MPKHDEEKKEEMEKEKDEDMQINNPNTPDKMEKDEEKLFFSLDTIRETCYIYSVGERRLREDGSLHKTIVTQMKGKTNDETPNVSFGVFPTNYETDYGYVIAYSPNIQN